MTDAPYRIGEVARKASTSARALRYYELLGLLTPAAHTPGGSRRYGENEISRVMRIRELQAIMGFDLEQIGQVLRAEDRLEQLRNDYLSGAAKGHETDLVLEAIAINDELRQQVREKISVLRTFLRELDAKAARYREGAPPRRHETAPATDATVEDIGA